jgi:hypothetical protein
MPSSEALLDQFRERFSEARMEPYEFAADGDPELAIELYGWNLRVSGAFLADLGVAEVLLRNAFDQVLRKKYQSRLDDNAWYDQNGVLFEPEWPIVEKAKRDARDFHDVPADQDEVTAALTFGFWLSLLHQRYEQRLWPILTEAFSAIPSGVKIRRDTTRDRVKHLVELRNGIAHHDPIFDWDLGASFQSAKTVCGYISPHVQAWMVSRSQVQQVLEQHPIPFLMGTHRN